MELKTALIFLRAKESKPWTVTKTSLFKRVKILNAVTAFRHLWPIFVLEIKIY